MQQFDNHQPQEIPEVIPFIESEEWIETKNELYKMMKAYMERMNQQREQEALLAAQRERELLAQKQATQEKEEPPQNYVFHQLIEEMCGTKASAEQKQKLEDTMLELFEDCQKKELYCMHNDVEDLIESALNSKLLLINLKSQRLDKEKPRIIHKESTIPLNNTPQISLVNAITHDLPTEEPEYSLSMGDKHLDTIPETELDVENLVPTPNPHYFNAESNLIESLLNRDTLIDSSPKFDYLLEEFSGELAHIDPIPPGIVDTDFEPEEKCVLI
ncbi:hypothetical protein Tco_0917232 [Tanacetum coccineum]